MNHQVQSRYHRDEKKQYRGQFHQLRQWLNIIFMIGAVVGMAVYLLHTPQTLGIIIILAAMVFKIVECALRFIK